MIDSRSKIGGIKPSFFMRYSEEQLNKFKNFLKRRKKRNRYLRIVIFLGIILFISQPKIQVLLALPYIVLYMYTFIYVIKFKKNIPGRQLFY